MYRLLRTLFCAALAAGFAAPLVAAAQAYPAKAIRIVMPFPPGSSVDSVSRLIAQKMSEAFGQPVVIDNRVGANGMIGSEYVARSAPDGYTLVFTTPSTHVTSIFLSKNVPYDPVKDFTPIGAAVEPLTCIVVQPSLPVNSLKELIEYAKRNPGKLTYGSTGVGSVFHLTGEALKIATGIDMLHVPYKGTADSLSAVMGGQISMNLTAVANAYPLVSAGKLKALVVLETVRYPAMPDVPVIGDVVPGFEKPASWFALFGPAGLPQPIVGRLNAEMVKALKAPDVRPKLDAIGLAVIANSPEQFAAMFKRAFEVYGKVVKAAGIKPE
jgi:tripartite-type tricarboxylate transporter receptor subunit TctC